MVVHTPTHAVRDSVAQTRGQARGQTRGMWGSFASLSSLLKWLAVLTMVSWLGTAMSLAAAVSDGILAASLMSIVLSASVDIFATVLVIRSIRRARDRISTARSLRRR